MGGIPTRIGNKKVLVKLLYNYLMDNPDSRRKESTLKITK
jgi:hypothetical protein